MKKLSIQGTRINTERFKRHKLTIASIIMEN